MIINNDILRRDTVRLLKDIDQQIGEVEKQAKITGCEAYELRDGNGNWPLATLLLAKTQAYATLVALQVK